MKQYTKIRINEAIPLPIPMANFMLLYLFVIHEGLKVRLEDTLDDWVKIRLADGKIGWILAENAGEI